LTPHNVRTLVRLTKKFATVTLHEMTFKCMEFSRLRCTISELFLELIGFPRKALSSTTNTTP
jgi:hypothetical protein